MTSKRKWNFMCSRRAGVLLWAMRWGVGLAQKRAVNWYQPVSPWETCGAPIHQLEFQIRVQSSDAHPVKCLAFYRRLSVGRQRQHERGDFWRGVLNVDIKKGNKYADTLKSGLTGTQVNIMQSCGCAASCYSKPHYNVLWTCTKKKTEGEKSWVY